VPLKLEGDKVPRIRLAQPTTLSKFKTRKRRRETTGNCSWAIGDHVDAWVNDRYALSVFMQDSYNTWTFFLGTVWLSLWGCSPSHIEKGLNNVYLT
jgi:hypothetical protein